MARCILDIISSNLKRKRMKIKEGVGREKVNGKERMQNYQKKKREVWRRDESVRMRERVIGGRDRIMRKES